MGKKRGMSALNQLFGWVRRQSMKVKILMGVMLGFFALVVLGVTVKNQNHFFIASEAFHLAGIAVLFYKLLTKKTCSGLSLKTQELTAAFLVVRLICSLLMENDIHTLLDFVTLLLTLLIVYMMRFKLKSSYIKELDSMRLSYVVVPCAIIAVLINPNTHHALPIRIIWAFCVYLESVSVLPQLRLMQNAKLVETFTAHYVFALGVSRFFALAHWIIQIYETSGSYLFLLGRGYFWFFGAFISEMVQSFILADFCYYYVKCFVQGQLVMKMPV